MRHNPTLRCDSAVDSAVRCHRRSRDHGRQRCHLRSTAWKRRYPYRRFSSVSSQIRFRVGGLYSFAVLVAGGTSAVDTLPLSDRSADVQLVTRL